MKKKEKAAPSPKPKETRRSDLTKGIWGALLLMALGFLLVLVPDLGSAAAAMVIGWVLIGVGAIGILVGVLSWPVLGLGTVLISVAAAGLGVYILLNPLTLASIFGIAIGLYLLTYQGFGSLIESLKLRKMGLSFLPNLIVSLILTVLGAVLIFAPLTSSRLVMTLFGIGLIAAGGASTVLRAWAARKLSRPRQVSDIVDADD